MVTDNSTSTVKINKTKTGYTVRCQLCGYYKHLVTKQYPLTRIVAEIHAVNHEKNCSGYGKNC